MTASGRQPVPTAPGAIAGILLAAGTSARLGQPKQLLRFQGRPLARHVAAVALASGLTHLVVVVGHRAEEVRAALAGLPVEIVENAHFQNGQSTSLRAGLLALPRATSAAMVLLVDQPFIEAALIDRLISLYQESGAPIVAPRFKDRRGNPVLFDASLFPELLAVVGDIGAREVIARHRSNLVTLELASDHPFLDIDTWDDYQRLTSDRPSQD